MKDVSQYPITFHYGATSYPYGTPNLPYHRGEDRACPEGTPLIVNGVQIGLSGNTGFSTGSHSHIGRFVGGASTNPNGGGFSFNDAVVTQVKEDAVNGKYVRVQADGASWVYLHLSQQTVQVGQRLTAPDPPPPAPPAVPYEIEDIPAKKMVINRPTSRWNMGYGDLDGMKNNPVESVEQGREITFTAKAYHRGVNMFYYLENRNNLGGFNVNDCSDWIAPPEYIPPAPPKQWPTAPATATDTTPYEVVKLLDGYETSNKAINHINPPMAPVGAGTYYVFNKRFADSDPSKLLAVNVTTKLGQPGAWINVADNVPDPEPEPEVIEEPAKPPKIVPTEWPNGNPREAPAAVEVVPEPVVEPLPEPKTVVRPNWRSSYVTFKDTDGFPEERLYVAMKDFEMVDQESTNRTAPVKNNDHIWMSGTFVGPDDQIYGMPTASRVDKAGNPRYWYYGCPMDREYVLTEQEVYNTTTTRKEREVIKVIQDVRVLTNRERNRQHAMKAIDLLTITPKEMESFVGKFFDFITGRAKKTTVQVNQSAVSRRVTNNKEQN